MANGKLIPQYEVHCAVCEEPNLGIASERSRAVAILKEEGWRLRNGLWHCPDCLDKTPPAKT